MKHLNGKSVYKGVALGKVLVLKKEDYLVKRVKIENPDEEVKRVEEMCIRDSQYHLYYDL